MNIGKKEERKNKGNSRMNKEPTVSVPKVSNRGSLSLFVIQLVTDFRSRSALSRRIIAMFLFFLLTKQPHCYSNVVHEGRVEWWPSSLLSSNVIVSHHCQQSFCFLWLDLKINSRLDYTISCSYHYTPHRFLLSGQCCCISSFPCPRWSILSHLPILWVSTA